MRFTDTELSTISNALVVARDRYRDNARDLGGFLSKASPAYRSLAEQFNRQAEEVSAIIERIGEEAGV